MAENRPASLQGSNTSSCRSDTVCIDTYRVLDSCRDRDCFEDVRVFFDAYGQSIIDRGGNVRAIDTKIVSVYIGLEEIPFNDGFYQLNLKYYLIIRFEACINGKSYTFCGAAAVEKKVVLWGGEGNVSIFKSTEADNYCCVNTEYGSNSPVGVVETVSPIALGIKVLDCSCNCGCCCVPVDEYPDAISCLFENGLVDPEEGNRLYLSLGIFSVIRIERPAQYLIHAVDYCVPDKECISSNTDDPCSLFRSMAFPVDEFSSSCCDQAESSRCRCSKDKT